MHIYQWWVVVLVHVVPFACSIKNNNNNNSNNIVIENTSSDAKNSENGLQGISRSAKAITFFPEADTRQVASRRIRFEDEDYSNNFIGNDINQQQDSQSPQRGPNGYINYPIYSYKPPRSQYIRPDYNQYPQQQQSQRQPEYYLVDYYKPQRPKRPQYQQPKPPQYYPGQFSSPSAPYYQSNDFSGPGSGPNYANQYYYRPGPSGDGGEFGGGNGGGGVGGLLGNIGNLANLGGVPGGQVGGQFGSAVENIVRYDDQQCVPKIVCQMVGNPKRQATLPAWLNAPSLTALISAVPSTSPLLVFGRAALLGLSGGELSCDSAYPRCPRNEDDVLHYLNNHRGGFFKFFNGGAAYGDDDDYNYAYQQQQQQQQQQYRPPPSYQQNPTAYPAPAQTQAGSLDLGTLQSFAEAINQGGGINLSNLGSNLGLLGNLASLGSALSQNSQPAKTQPETSSLNVANLASNLGLLSNLGSQLGLGNTVSNLLTGIVGARFASRKSRKIKKRSTDEGNEDSNKNPPENWEKFLISLADESGGDSKAQSKKRNLNKEIGDDATRSDSAQSLTSHGKRKKYQQEVEKKDKIRQIEKLLGIHGRILSKGIDAEERIVNTNYEVHQNAVSFPEEVIRPNHVYNLAPSTNFVFPPFYNDDRSPKAVQFSHTSTSNQPYNQLQFPENYQTSDGIILDIPKPLPLEYYDRTKMIFPDRTGTGNLRFDNDHIFKDITPVYDEYTRYGRILTGSSRPSSSFHTQYDNTGAITYNRGDVLVFHSHDQNNRKPAFDFGNRYPIQQNQQSSTPVNFNNQQQQYQPSSYQNYQSQSSQLAESNGQKIYVTNSQGVVEYYINERGDKVRV